MKHTHVNGTDQMDVATFATDTPMAHCITCGQVSANYLPNEQPKPAHRLTVNYNLPLNSAERFFYDIAGYSWDAKTETEDQGRVRTAKSLAMSEDYAREKEWVFEWSRDEENPRDVFGEPDPVNGPFYDPHAEFFTALVRSRVNGPVLASLGMIEDPTPEYRRVVEAELAGEVITFETVTV